MKNAFPGVLITVVGALLTYWSLVKLGLLVPKGGQSAATNITASALQAAQLPPSNLGRTGVATTSHGSATAPPSNLGRTGGATTSHGSTTAPPSSLGR